MSQSSSRPVRLNNPEVQEQILVGVRAGGGLDMAAAALKHPITARGIQKLAERDPVFKERLESARGFRRDMLVRGLYEVAKPQIDPETGRIIGGPKDTTAAIYLLKCWDPENYGQRSEVHHSGLEDLILESYREHTGGDAADSENEEAVLESHTIEKPGRRKKTARRKK